ncbi:MAG: phosphatase PAP2 family protein [Alphaproteobacteria bacterium]|nr:phosphatase PAP2 family protein [Alphaproteobacteria bacterium]MCL2504934.1 phosphatase PAP2 family protein [Alphaproteobacteria bacterium]
MPYFLRAFSVLALITYSPNCYAKSAIEQIGDYTQVIVPAYAFGMAVQEEGWEGTRQFIYSFGAMQASVLGLKYSIDAKRPNGCDNRSFPSGHTAAAFSGATFIHKRYGIERAIIPYMVAGFTGYSRVHAEKHYWYDVVAGAAISGLFTWIFVDEYNYDKLQVSADPKSVYVGYKTEF